MGGGFEWRNGSCGDVAGAIPDFSAAENQGRESHRFWRFDVGGDRWRPVERRIRIGVAASWRSVRRGERADANGWQRVARESPRVVAEGLCEIVVGSAPHVAEEYFRHPTTIAAEETS